MCGILAVINRDGSRIEKSLVCRMRDAMQHRGPDDAGVYIKDSIALAHRRLSIIDLTDSGHQPMTNADQSVCIVFNGEIFNYLELMEDLKKKGHEFKSSSDTEVLIHLYEEEGENLLDKINGMFSFVIWDEKQNVIFCARDRMGIKPLYYFSDHRKLILASEIKAILEDPYIKRQPNDLAISDYYFAGRPLAGKTVFENINELEAGYALSVDLTNNKIKEYKYWDVEFCYDYSRSDEDVREQLFYLLDDAVKVHCRSDATLGCHLSGGMDTSTIVAFAAKYREALKTFSIKFSNEPYIDETEYAKAVNNHVGASYFEDSPTAEEFAGLLPYLMWHMDMPMATGGGFSYYTVSKLAQRHVKVSLTGHGGDELFAGYPAQFRAAFNSVDMFTPQKRDPNIQNTNFTLQENFRITPIKSYLGILSRKAKNYFRREEASLENLWINLHCRHVENNPIFTSGFIKRLNGYSSAEDYIQPLLQAKAEHNLDKVLYHDQRIYLPSLLHLEDRASMALSIESRVPFLDYRIVEFLATIPPEQKVKNLQPKYLMRSVASTLLPEKVVNRSDKRPFPVPGKFWMTDKMQEMVRDILLSPSSLQRGVFHPRALQYAAEKDINLAWPLLNIELWYKIFIDNSKRWMDRVKMAPTV